MLAYVFVCKRACDLLLYFKLNYVLCESVTGLLLKRSTLALSGESPKSFMPVLTVPDSNMLCAMDTPSNIMSLAGVGGFPHIAQCAMKCTGDGNCRGFNVMTNTRLCQMYSYSPTRFALVPGCEYRQVAYLMCLFTL